MLFQNYDRFKVAFMLWNICVIKNQLNFQWTPAPFTTRADYKGAFVLAKSLSLLLTIQRERVEKREGKL